MTFREVMRLMSLTNHVVLYRSRSLTRDELFVALARILSADPALLPDARLLLDVDSETRAGFEVWLSLLAPDTRLSAGGDHPSRALLDALSAERRRLS